MLAEVLDFMISSKVAPTSSAACSRWILVRLRLFPWIGGVVRGGEPASLESTSDIMGRRISDVAIVGRKGVRGCGRTFNDGG